MSHSGRNNGRLSDMGPMAKMCVSFFGVAVFAIVSSGIYMTLKGRLGLDATLGTTPVIIINSLLACMWYMYASTLQCRNCGAGLTAGALGVGDKCRKCG